VTFSVIVTCGRLCYPSAY